MLIGNCLIVRPPIVRDMPRPSASIVARALQRSNAIAAAMQAAPGVADRPNANVGGTPTSAVVEALTGLPTASTNFETNRIG
jgi:hypothetical protein